MGQLATNTHSIRKLDPEVGLFSMLVLVVLQGSVHAVGECRLEAVGMILVSGDGIIALADVGREVTCEGGLFGDVNDTFPSIHNDVEKLEVNAMESLGCLILETTQGFEKGQDSHREQVAEGTKGVVGGTTGGGDETVISFLRFEDRKHVGVGSVGEGKETGWNEGMEEGLGLGDEGGEVGGWHAGTVQGGEGTSRVEVVNGKLDSQVFTHVQRVVCSLVNASNKGKRQDHVDISTELGVGCVDCIRWGSRQDQRASCRGPVQSKISCDMRGDGVRSHQ